MREKNRAGRRLTWASAMLLILCLITGSVLAGYLISIAGADKNMINLDGTPGKGLMLTESRKLTVGAARRLGFEAIGDDEEEAWSTDTQVDIFRVSYDKNGQATVKSETSDKLIAPGTENSYSFHLKNTTSKYVDYSMWVEAKVEPENIELPFNVRMSGRDGAWLLGSESGWGKPLELNNVKEEGRLRRSEASSYTLTWQWPYEQGNDALDTLLGNRAEQEDLSFSIVIHTLATGYEGGGSGDSDDGGSGGGNSGTSGTKPGPGAETTAPSGETGGSGETTGSNESSGTPETTAPNESGSTGTSDGSETTGGSESRPSGGTHGTSDGTDGNQGQNGAGNRDENGSSDNQNGMNGNGSQTGKDQDSDKNQIQETTGAGENTETGDGKETAADGSESRSGKLPWWLWPAGLLGLLLLLLFRRRIYVTGFVTGMSGSDMNWKRGKDRIRPDGRFVFEKMPFGTHTFTVTDPSGTAKVEINWKLKRDNSITGVRIENQDGTCTVYAGKHVRAIELYFDTDRGELSLRPSKWAAIDIDRNVYTPTGKTAPAENGTNITPGGLEVDKEKKLHIHEK